MTNKTHTFDDYFPHKQLDKVAGTPSTKSLQTVFRQLRRNARSVNSSLGGGQYGHLFLVLTEDDWNNLPDTVPVIEPTNPGPFELVGNRPNAATVVVQEKLHDEQKKNYEKFQALKRILKNQLVEAFDSIYLDPIRCTQTDMITMDLPEIMDFLKSSYGEMTVDEIEEETSAIKQFPFDPSVSIDILLNKVQTHSEICAIAGSPLSDKQVIDLAYYIINKTATYKQYLIDWNKLPAPKTWNDFKLHMRRAYSDLKKVKGLTIKESSLHTSDMVINELKNHQTELIHEVENRCNEKFVEMINYTANHQDTDIENQQSQENSFNVSNEISNLKMQLQFLTNQLQQFQQTLQTTNTKNVRFTKDTKPPVVQWPSYPTNKFNSNKPKQKKYCWTHGACAHTSAECKTPAQGHQPFATFRNRLNGNNAGCIMKNNGQAFKYLKQNNPNTQA